MPAPAGVSARAYRRISVPPAATRVSIPALPDVLPDQGSHVSVAAIRFTFTVRRTIPAPVRGQPGQSRQSPPTPAEMRSGSIVRQDPRAATMLLMVGLPGAGKTTRAKELA